MSLELITPIERVPGVRAEEARALRRLGVPSVAHLVAYLPFRHEREEAEGTIAQLRPNVVCTTRGEITATQVSGFGRRKRFEATLMDESGFLDLVWFNQPYLTRKIVPGMRIRVQGKVSDTQTGFRMANPRWEVLHTPGDGAEPREKGARLRPIYHASEEIDSRRIESLVGSVLNEALALIDDHLPEEFRVERNMPGLREAYRMMHKPESEAEVSEARRRLAYDELLMLELAVHMRRAHLRRAYEAPALKWNESIDRHIRDRLPFTLTNDQDKAVADIVADLMRPHPANRLIQGDVGSGKTAVAVYAMLMAVASGCQAAMMAPTEILAEQHFASVRDLLKGSNVRIELLTGALRGEERQPIVDAIGSGEVDIVIGTHAILTEAVEFASLGTVVIDEQHRFGVHQRARLREKATEAKRLPHTIVMTATPIPRTLALTVFGDLDVSTIRELPPGRQPVETRWVRPDHRQSVYEHLRSRVDQGEQGFVVVPTIEEQPGETSPANVRDLVRYLEEGPLEGRRIAPVHGRLNRLERDSIMERFRSGRIDVVVATTVIEVGIDIPNATMMVIENADRFGLAQLHQLRGRVGRGEKPGVCALIASPTTDDGERRLRVISEVTDGFTLAERDLEIRGPGELIGSRQSGAMAFRVADLVKDIDLLLMARRDAAAWIERSPVLDQPGEELLRRRMVKAHGEQFGLIDVA